jgi:hypothetical protein
LELSLNWKDLSLIKKLIIGSLIIGTATLAPELMIIMNIGGIDLAFASLLFYYRPIIDWIKCKKQLVIDELKIARQIIMASAVTKPKVYTLNAIFCMLFVFTTGSLLFSISLFLPALFVSGVSI